MLISCFYSLLCCVTFIQISSCFKLFLTWNRYFLVNFVLYWTVFCVLAVKKNLLFIYKCYGGLLFYVNLLFGLNCRYYKLMYISMSHMLVLYFELQSYFLSQNIKVHLQAINFVSLHYDYIFLHDFNDSETSFKNAKLVFSVLCIA